MLKGCWEANSNSASQDIPHLLKTVKVLSCVCQRLILQCTLWQVSPALHFTLYFFKPHFNIVFQLWPVFLTGHFPSAYLDKAFRILHSSSATFHFKDTRYYGMSHVKINIVDLTVLKWIIKNTLWRCHLVKVVKYRINHLAVVKKVWIFKFH
jgi:hypothetical protein